MDAFFCFGCGRHINRWRARFCQHCGTAIPDARRLTPSELEAEREEFADLGGKCSQEYHDYLAILVFFCRYCGLRLQNKKAADCDHECHEQFESEMALNTKIAEPLLPCCIYCESCQQAYIYEKWIGHLNNCPILTRVSQRLKINREDDCRCKLHDGEMSYTPHPHSEPCCYRCQFCNGRIDKTLLLFHENRCVVNPDRTINPAT